MKQIPSLNALKLIAALAVVLMHAKLPVVSSVTLPLCKLAVPLFLMMSGYCLTDEDGYLRKESVGRAIPRIAKLALWANLLYILFNVVIGCFEGDPWRPLLRLLDSHFWTDLVCFGGTVSGHLWYLMAYLQVLLFIWLLMPRRVPRWVYWCIPLGIVLNLVIGNYGFLFDLHTSYQTSRNFFTIALPCVALGMWVRENGHRLRSLSIIAYGKGRLLLMAACVGLLYAESVLYKMYCPEHTADVWLMTVPAAAMVLVCGVMAPEWGRGRLSEWGRRWSLPIYIYHIMLLRLFAL